MECFLIFIITLISVIVLFVLFTFFTRYKNKPQNKTGSFSFSINLNFGKYLYFGSVYFVALFFASWVLNEIITKNVAWWYMTQLYEFILFIFQSALFLFVIGLYYLEMKKPNNIFQKPKKLKKLTISLLIILLIIIIPLASVSYLNKIKRDEQIKNLENQGITVFKSNYYFGGKTTPTPFYKLTEVIELVKINQIQVTISIGAPDYHFLTVIGPIQLWFFSPEGRISMIEI